MAFGTQFFNGFLKGAKMELSKETKDKLWAATDLVTTIYDLNKKRTTSHDVVVLK